MTDQPSPDSQVKKRSGALLDRPLPDGYLAEWAQHFATRPDDDSDHVGEEDRTVLLFRIGEEWLALPTAILQEVASPRRPHALPHRRDKLVRGLVNVRGELLICISLGALLGIDDAAPAGEGAKSIARLVVIAIEGGRIAFQVDEVHGVHRYAARDVVDTPATIGRSASSFAATMIAWNGRTVGRLEVARLAAALDRAVA
jgi:chemotaxis-related protein WspD